MVVGATFLIIVELNGRLTSAVKRQNCILQDVVQVEEVSTKQLFDHGAFFIPQIFLSFTMLYTYVGRFEKMNVCKD